jgi:hypothetical protein
MKTAQKGLDLLGQEKRKDRYSRERQKRNIEERLPLEVLGHLGFIPFYKDLRRALIKDINRTIDYKEPKGLTKDEMKKYMPDLYEQVYGWQEELKKDSEGINSAEEDAKKRREEILKNMFGK